MLETLHMIYIMTYFWGQEAQYTGEIQGFRHRCGNRGAVGGGLAWIGMGPTGFSRIEEIQLPPLSGFLLLFVDYVSIDRLQMRPPCGASKFFVNNQGD
jgi:hypothetical protein